MEATVGKWGNSLGIRISKAMAEEAGLEKDTPVLVTVTDGVITITPIQRRSRRAGTTRRPLSEYLEEITPEKIHGETKTGRAVGRERL